LMYGEWWHQGVPGCCCCNVVSRLKHSTCAYYHFCWSIVKKVLSTWLCDYNLHNKFLLHCKYGPSLWCDVLSLLQRSHSSNRPSCRKNTYGAQVSIHFALNEIVLHTDRFIPSFIAL
jgi:hypothetical protein